MLRYIGLLLLIPLLDAILLVVLAGFVLNWQLIILLVVATALVGMLLARFEGRHTIRKIQTKLGQGEPPTDELIDGGLLLVAGAFLLTPGLVTDLLGFLFVVPLTRYPIRVGLKKRVIVPYVDQRTGGFATGNVYIGGFPDGGPFDDQNDTPPEDGDVADDSGTNADSFDGVDLGDVKDVDYEDVEDEGNSNA
ncbi:MAG: protein affecting phage T7 exclusion by the F plasmid [halophilic archaeon J07HX64]|jgi:Protein affecting phage T7 exclusion by the F plasmid|nr:MAG: protein affecting phage T7 exclusion by the F plasmid [halophilic archaeon J07HX64]